MSKKSLTLGNSSNVYEDGLSVAEYNAAIGDIEEIDKGEWLEYLVSRKAEHGRQGIYEGADPVDEVSISIHDPDFPNDKS